uniref:Uncharacterized protein n=1 Tax=Glycine max TaxID=3847 RepID=C6T734_SOYBN|nr:unknown [Glycine max]
MAMQAGELCQHQSPHCPLIFFNPIPDFGSFSGGLFLEPKIPDSFVRSISLKIHSTPFSESNPRRHRRRVPAACFLSVSLPSANLVTEPKLQNGEHVSDQVTTSNGVVLQRKVRVRGGNAVNTTKHLWAGAVAAMVSRTCVAPLERLKLEYIVRGEKRSIFELISKIASSQGLRGFWKGNLVNILRTAPFKAVNFCAYDTYRKQLLRFSGNEETTKF